MEKIKSIAEINETVISRWNTARVGKILNAKNSEDELLEAFENDLYETPNDLKINPRELIYALHSNNKFSAAFKKEVKAVLKKWISMKSTSWDPNAPPFYSVELEYIERFSH